MFWMVTVMIVVLATVPSVAHALELPGKMRLSKDEYAVMQRVYYPGFTVAGLAEPVGILMTLILLICAPLNHKVWFTLALAGLAGMQMIYWLITHPVNKVWIEGQRLGAASGRFFAAGADRTESQDWVVLRNRWEYSHVARAGCSVVSLVSLLISGC
jgi:Domain of unknown function (DUF1772)